MSDGWDVLRAAGGARLDALAAVPDAPGAYAIRPADGRAASALGLSGGAETVLFVEAAEESLGEAVAEHLAPAYAGDSDLRAELAVWLAEVRGAMPWSRQTRFGAEADEDDRLLSAYAERMLTAWMRASLRVTWTECAPKAARRLRDRAAGAQRPVLQGRERAPIWRDDDVVDERAAAQRGRFFRREIWARWLTANAHHLLDPEPERRFVCKLGRDGRPQGAPHRVDDGRGAGKGWAMLPAIDPERARRHLLALRPERWYADEWTAAHGPAPAWDVVVDDLGDREAPSLAILARLGDDPADPFGEDAGGPPGGRPDAVEGGKVDALFTAISDGLFPLG
jgi:hypothetical protein